MGMTGAIKLKRVVENTRNVIAIEAMAAAQAVDFLAPLKPSKRGQAAVAAIRTVSPAIEKDRVMSGDFERISALLATGRLAELVR
jgi:histidine ammonia-lyase